MYPKISVIVPVYKAEKYIKECVNSIRRQSYRNLEIILVDDGSPDNSPKMCDEFAEKDSRIKVIHKENAGRVTAWICGLENTGEDVEFITFIDADDWISEKYIEIMVMAQLETHADIVLVDLRKENYNHIYEGGFIIPASFYDREALEKEVYPIMLNAGDFESRGLSVSRCAKLIRKQMIYDNLKYCSESITYAEDLNIIFPVYLDAKSIMIVDSEEAVYFYRVNTSSMSNSYDENMLRSISHVHPSLIQICKDKGREEMISQVYGDFLAASVQYFKNELQNPKGIKETRRNIKKFTVKNDLLKDALNSVNWHKYRRKLNKIIIGVLSNYNWFNAYIVTSVLCVLKKYRVWRFSFLLRK